MLPVEQGKGQIWRRDQFLCNVEYSISARLDFADRIPVQHITLVLANKNCQPLLDAYDLTLVLADGSRWTIPRPLNLSDREHLESFIQSPL
jgi:hypothetical protein